MSHIFGANAQVAILNELFATTRTKARGRKGLISVGSPFATRLSSRDESCLSIKHHDSMGRVSLFRCEHRGCNFKRTFCNQVYEKRVFFFGRPSSPSQKTAFVKGRNLFVDQAPRFNGTCQPFSVRTHTGCIFKRTFCNHADEKSVFFLERGAPPPPPLPDRTAETGPARHTRPVREPYESM